MVISKRVKKRLRILKSLNPAPLSNNRGRLLRESYPRPNRKTRRHSGRKYPMIFGPQRILDEEGIFVDYFWDDWGDYRDGFRDRTRLFGYPCCFHWDDHLQMHKETKIKLKKHLNIRRAMKTLRVSSNGLGYRPHEPKI